jgi:hypothetical protein
MVDLNGHEAGNGGYSQGKPTAYWDSSTRREAIYRQLTRGASLLDPQMKRPSSIGREALSLGHFLPNLDARA